MFMEFKNCATSLGWDEAKQTIVCSPEWWEEHLAVSTILSPCDIFFLFFVIVCLANFIYLISEM